MYVQPPETMLASGSLSPLSDLDGDGLSDGSYASGMLSQDGISRSVPPWLGANGGFDASDGQTQGSLASLMQQLMQMLQQFMGYSGTGSSGTGCSGWGCSSYGNEQYFQNATGSSNGDPHLSFNGSHWNSMASQPDLLDSNSIPGGFQISTRATAPNANGVTHNQSATVSLDGGATTVSMNKNGTASITSYGSSVAISPGQTVQLGNGASVTQNANGSLTVVATNGTGGSITTQLAAKNGGVNVDVSAHDVDLGGSLVNGTAQSSPPIGSPQPPIIGPVSPISPPIDPMPPIDPQPVDPPVSPPPHDPIRMQPL